MKKSIKVIRSLVLFLLFVTMERPAFSTQEISEMRIVGQGSSMSSNQVSAHEAALAKNPEDLSARLMLMGYYYSHSSKSPEMREKRRRHALWMIKNRPESEVAGSPYAYLNPILDGSLYSDDKANWLRQVRTRTNNLSIIGNAAQFFLIHDRKLAETLYKKAKALDPKNPKWAKQLGHLYSLKSASILFMSSKATDMKALEQIEEAMSLSTGTKKFYLLTTACKAACDAGELKKASKYATALLLQAPQNKKDWNYGNAIHHGNLILGRVALAGGDVKTAEKHLLAAGATPGSPQLNSFGPNMKLAKELLAKGRKKAVLKYFNLCKKFWKMKKDKLQKWTAIVEAGGIPSFGGNLRY